MNTQSKEDILKNRLRVKTTIEVTGVTRWLTLQGCAFRAKLDEKINEVILENAPKNPMYISPQIQKQVLHILAEMLRNQIRQEVRDAKFCILVDEAQDNSIKEQMAIVLRFVDIGGFVRERFFGIVGVRDTKALTLKNEISDVLSHYNLHIENMQRQGYDGASNMRGTWNGLQALFLKECPCAYYVHCFAHRLQLALLAASKDVHDIWLFFSKLASIVNLVSASPKCRNELQFAQEYEVALLLATGENKTALQEKSQDILNAMNLVSTTKALLQELKNEKWNSFLENLLSFCKKHDIDTSNMDDRYMIGTRRLCMPILHFRNMSTVFELCEGLVETRKSIAYNLVDRLIRLVLTHPVSTATTERVFLAMKIVKTQLRNKMNDEFLADCMVIYIEREFVKGIDVESVVDEFDSVPRRAQLH
ncbi:hypothetical protein AQUCO_01100017v1 [Aquilegia coerulea]|uniref:DUF4371 domain-containing protein n=1 Tax=Aquilegia coerulea TaxID=218851 RepID=A0A2G5E593_AQUCA|nr:hypothetical protein AQUCO_01100017v1 [Aquilegia coerulea]